MAVYSYPPTMRRLINELMKLPSVGEKSAVRLAYHLLTCDQRDAVGLSESIKEAREKIQLCDLCFGISESALCPICSDANRARNVICVVEKPADVIVVERSGGHRGLYHVLHGLWAPLRGVTPEQTKISELFSRLRDSYAGNDPEHPPIDELILATSTTVEGDATALYIGNAVSEYDVKITRIAQGLPKGGELEYADEITLSHAMEGRQRLN